MEYLIKDREGNLYVEEESKAISFFYGTVTGRSVMKLFSIPIFSKIAGRYLSSHVSKMSIKSFVKKNDIDVNEFEKKRYKSFNDFFTRKKKWLSFITERKILGSPSDAKLICYKIDEDGIYNIKGTNYSIKDLLDGDPIYKEYLEGDMLVFRLVKSDYHRYHYIDNGVQGKRVFIPGTLNTVRPIAFRKINVFKRNAREYTILHTDNYGAVIEIEVGAVLVGRIVNIHEGSYKFKKGEEKGYFEFGGSTVILLFKKDVIKLDDDIIKNSSENIETIVKCGERIGKKN